MANIPEPMTWIGLGVLVISNVGLWIDKVYQGKKQVRIGGRNGSSLERLHTKIDTMIISISTIDKNTAVAANEIKNMQKKCDETTQRYEKRLEKIENGKGE